MRLVTCFGWLAGLLLSSAIAAQEPVTFTTEEDHRNMLAQLGITRLRPGASGNPQAANSANYDESLANPFPNLPEVLKLKSGQAVTTPDEWWNERRPEIVEDFKREVLGRVPANVPTVKWEVLETKETTVGKTAAVEKRLQGKVDNSACPSIEVNIVMTLVTPKEAKEPVPVLMMFTFGFGGAGAGKRGGPAAKAKFAPMGPSRFEQLLAAGWGYATIVPASIQADNGAGLTRGIIGLANRGQPRKPEDWGSLRAWAWGASRGLDYLETDPAVDARRVGIEGVSRYGKAALVTMAMDTRFAMVLVGSSGEGGAKLHRRNFGEAVENLTGSGEYHWMAGNFLKYGAEESSFGKKNAGDIPVDAHQLIALCAPRLTFISYGIPERGDAKWLDQQGSFMAAVAAGPVFRLLGAKDLGTTDDYLTEKMPAVNVGLLAGELAWRQHDGGHTDGPNIEHFIAWADKKFAQSGKASDDAIAMQGTWIPTTAELAGAAMPEAVLKTIVLKIEGGKYEVTVAGTIDRGTCTLNAAAKPKQLTISGTEGPNKGKTYPCIYELSGDTLRVCYDLSGKETPTEFKTTAGTQLYLVTYARQKE